MKLLIFSDLQGVDYREWSKLIEMSPSQYDATILLGDIEDLFLKTIQERFSTKPLFGVLGNHDYEGDLEYFNIENIHGKRKEVNDTTFVGLKGSIRYKPGNFPMLTQAEATIYCRSFDYADIIISHNSPRGVHDKPDLAHKGFEGLTEYIQVHQPRFALHGHQHKNQVTLLGNTTVVAVYGAIILDTETNDIHQVLHIL
ncbi:metallophosphoesterase family protein (plasmid) [Paenibacillus thiaminolyticus]|uniref:metallophosphoesterase family protein n=1 Tax=Paenibacillus thiaminolyticus TaxID=49283 RepID=UPI00232B74F4|nr:metallophosphoesterase [Paenibacillus thiaminolyticus]WCF11507.1 metallophosphoesterase family protein [Paenibacillus thiaminolyticus]